MSFNPHLRSMACAVIGTLSSGLTASAAQFDIVGSNGWTDSWGSGTPDYATDSFTGGASPLSGNAAMVYDDVAGDPGRGVDHLFAVPLTGTVEIKYNVFIPTGHNGSYFVAYYMTDAADADVSSWGGAYANPDGYLQIEEWSTPGVAGPGLTRDVWQEIKMVLDFNAGTAQYFKNDVAVGSPTAIAGTKISGFGYPYQFAGMGTAWTGPIYFDNFSVVHNGTTIWSDNFDSYISSGPPNDNFANAIALPGDSGSRSGSGNVGGTFEVGEPDDIYAGDDYHETVWFKWTPTESGTFSVSTTGTLNLNGDPWDAVLCIYDGATLGTLNQRVFSDNSQDETASLAVTAGTTYSIRVSWGGGPNGDPVNEKSSTDIHLAWSFTPPPPSVPDVVSIDVVRSDSAAVSGDVAGSPVSGQGGAWNPLVGGTEPQTLSTLTNGAGATATGVGFQIVGTSGTTGFQGSDTTGVVLAANNPERLWVTGTGTRTFAFTGLTVGANYGLAIFNTGSPLGIVTINGGTPHTAVPTVLTTSEVADANGKITIVSSFNGGAHTDYFEISGFQIYPLAAPPSLTADAGVDRSLSPGSPSAQLGATPAATGGTAPYTYSWSPSTGLDDATLEHPTVTTTDATTTYTLTVTDSTTATATDEVIVTYALPPLVAAAGADKTVSSSFPSAVIGGSPSASGGSGSYFYSWDPATDLDDATAANPTASPSSTTTYTLTVTDSLGTPQATDQVTVTYVVPNTNLISVDFVYSDLAVNTPYSGDTLLTGTLNKNSAGQIYTGQVGAWNAMLVGTNNGSSSSATKTGLANGGGTTTTVAFKMGTATSAGASGGNWKPGYVATTGGNLREEQAYIYYPAITSNHFNWELTGLTPNGHYRLTLFGDGGSTFTNIANSVAAVMDAEGDWDWNDIQADAAGVIAGNFLNTASNNAVHLIYGLQLEASGAPLSGYETWALLHAGGGSADDDFNHDGVSNGVAYFMGATVLATNPGVVDGKVTWPHDPTAQATFIVQYSENLVDWIDVVPPNLSIDESESNQVTFTLPGGTATQFCRLVVTVTP